MMDHVRGRVVQIWEAGWRLWQRSFPGMDMSYSRPSVAALELVRCAGGGRGAAAAARSEEHTSELQSRI